MVGDAMRINAHVDVLHPVIHADGQDMFAGCGIPADVEPVWRAQAVLHAYLIAVDPYTRFPVRPLEEEFRTCFKPRIGYGYFALVPRRRSEEHTSELPSLMRISYAVF